MCDILQAAEEQWEVLAQKRATLVVAAASHWRQKVYLRPGEVRVDISGGLWQEFETPLNLMKNL